MGKGLAFLIERNCSEIGLYCSVVSNSSPFPGDLSAYGCVPVRLLEDMGLFPAIACCEERPWTVCVGRGGSGAVVWRGLWTPGLLSWPGRSGGLDPVLAGVGAWVASVLSWPAKVGGSAALVRPVRVRSGPVRAWPGLRVWFGFALRMPLSPRYWVSFHVLPHDTSRTLRGVCIASHSLQGRGHAVWSVSPASGNFQHSF